MCDEHTDEVCENIDGFMSGPLDGFFSKYFGDAAADVEFQKRVREICERSPLQGATTSIEGFRHWMSSLAVEKYAGARGSWKAVPLSRFDQRYETDLSTHVAVALTRSNPVSEPGDATADVQVIGEFCPGQAISYKEGLLKLCAKASSIFTIQPTRLFLHAFYLRGSWAELFVFDRCGLYSCNVFDIEKDFQRFVTVIWKYSSMTDAELGLSDLIKRDGMGPYITLKEDASFASSTLRLAEQPLATPEDLVSKATTCFKARLPGSDRWDYVVKFKWRLRDDIAEDDVLRHATVRNVWGLLSLEYFDQIIDTADLRSGLRHRPYRRFPSESDPEPLVQGANNSLDSNTIETEKSFRVRTMVCIITSPCGRPLHTHKSTLELLQVLRDTVRAHRSLYADGGILHQDIAPGNIVISDSPDPGAGGSKGILIDLDVAMVLEVGPRNPGGVSITGTPPFMAVAALEGRPRTYAHDVESFLYVLLWAIISDGAVSPPGGSRLQGWRGGSYEEIAARKVGDMAPGGFQSILAEFAPRYWDLRELAEGFRRLLFPGPGGGDGTGLSSAGTGAGTGVVGSRDEGGDALYEGVLGLFDQAIDRCKS